MVAPAVLHLPRRLWVWAQVGTRSSGSTGLPSLHPDPLSPLGGTGPYNWHPAVILELRVDPDRFPDNDDVALNKGWGDLIWSPSRFRASPCPVPPPTDRQKTNKKKAVKTKGGREEVLLGTASESVAYRSCYLGCRPRKAPQTPSQKQTAPMMPWDFLYYVHFKGRNRRHDKWRRLDDMVPIECNPSSPETLSSSVNSLIECHSKYANQEAWAAWLASAHAILDSTSPFGPFFDLHEKKRSTRRTPKAVGPLEWVSHEGQALPDLSPYLAFAWTREAWILRSNDRYPDLVPDEVLPKRKPNKVISSDFLQRQINVVANFRHFTGRSKRQREDTDTKPTKKRKVRNTDSPSAASLVGDADTSFTETKEGRLAAYTGPLNFMTPILGDLALHGSLGDTDCEEYACMDSGAQSLHEDMTLVKAVERVAFGSTVVDTWYFSPYPREIQPVETLFVCEWCLEYFRYKLEMQYHARYCTARHPPGSEIFRLDGLSLFEVDGAKCQQYCRNLCFFGKLFLDHKTLQYDTEPFLFYCLTEADRNGCQLVGYFSKEKVSDMGYNLSCIVTWPHQQRKSFGKILQTMSYTLSLFEGKMGSPEKPLSDLGAAAYDSYWLELLVTLMARLKLDATLPPGSESLTTSLSFLHTALHRLASNDSRNSSVTTLSVDELAHATAITRADVHSILSRTKILRTVAGSQVLWLPATEVATHLATTGRPCRAIPPAAFHFVPWSSAAPRSHEALPSLPQKTNGSCL